MNGNKLYLLLICNKFNYLFIQIILFVLVLTLDPYDTPQNEWGVSYIRQVSLTLLCTMMILRFIYLNYSKVFIAFLLILSASSILYSEIIKLLSQFNLAKFSAEFLVQNNIESILTILITIFVIVSLTSNQKEQNQIS